MRILLAVRSAGYKTVTIGDYVRALHGDWSQMPSRPILVTFDDGRLDGYRGADDVLRVLGERAVTFIITARPDRNEAFFMHWSEIAAAEDSGRWDVQLHAHEGHVRIRVDPSPEGATRGSFYGWRRYDLATPSDGGQPDRGTLESFIDWKARVESDILIGRSRLASHLGDRADRATSFALPYGDYGQLHSNDPAIAPELRVFLDAHYAVWFTQEFSDPDFTTTLSPTHEACRYTIFGSTTAEQVYAWLARHATTPPKH
jgi:peptidoglycan/xylan/chitin deacetylase (PgdA/CDA1 family)